MFGMLTKIWNKIKMSNGKLSTMSVIHMPEKGKQPVCVKNSWDLTK